MHHVVLINVILRQSCLVHLGDEPPHRLLARVGHGTEEQQELECAEERRRDTAAMSTTDASDSTAA